MMSFTACSRHSRPAGPLRYGAKPVYFKTGFGLESSFSPLSWYAEGGFGSSQCLGKGGGGDG